MTAVWSTETVHKVSSCYSRIPVSIDTPTDPEYLEHLKTELFVVLAAEVRGRADVWISPEHTVLHVAESYLDAARVFTMAWKPSEAPGTLILPLPGDGSVWPRPTALIVRVPRVRSVEHLHPDSTFHQFAVDTIEYRPTGEWAPECGAWVFRPSGGDAGG